MLIIILIFDIIIVIWLHIRYFFPAKKINKKVLRKRRKKIPQILHGQSTTNIDVKFTFSMQIFFPSFMQIEYKQQQQQAIKKLPYLIFFTCVQ